MRFQKAEDVIAIIEQRKNRGYGLDHFKQYMASLGNPQDVYKRQQNTQQQNCQNRTDAAQCHDTKAFLFCMLLCDSGHTDSQRHEKGDGNRSGCNSTTIEGNCHEGIDVYKRQI